MADYFEECGCEHCADIKSPLDLCCIHSLSMLRDLVSKQNQLQHHQLQVLQSVLLRKVIVLLRKVIVLLRTLIKLRLTPSLCCNETLFLDVQTNTQQYNATPELE